MQALPPECRGGRPSGNKLKASCFRNFVSLEVPSMFQIVGSRPNNLNFRKQMYAAP